MLRQEAQHLAYAKYRADNETDLDRRPVAAPDLARTRATEQSLRARVLPRHVGPVS